MGVGAFFYFFMTLARQSPCKINLLLNILGRRPDGYHELETVFHPVGLADRLEFTRLDRGIQLTCNHPGLPTDATNLVYRAAAAFFCAAGIATGVRIQLEKNIPLAAGLGGGSSNAAAALLGLNELFAQPLAADRLFELGASLGSDVPFFLQSKPALGTGRGERIEALDFFPALRGVYVLLIHPGFGVSTAWAYQELRQHPEALHGQPGRARRLLSRLQTGDLRSAAGDFYNSLEVPVLRKYPLLALFQEFLREQGAPVTLMSGSGSTTYALLPNEPAATALLNQFKTRFGESHWTAVAPV